MAPRGYISRCCCLDLKEQVTEWTTGYVSENLLLNSSVENLQLFALLDSSRPLLLMQVLLKFPLSLQTLLTLSLQILFMLSLYLFLLLKAFLLQFPLPFLLVLSLPPVVAVADAAVAADTAPCV